MSVITALFELGVNNREKTLHSQIRNKLANNHRAVDFIEAKIIPFYRSLKSLDVKGLECGSEGQEGSLQADKATAIKFYVNNKWLFSLEFSNQLTLILSNRQQIMKSYPRYSLLANKKYVNGHNGYYSIDLTQGEMTETAWHELSSIILDAHKSNNLNSTTSQADSYSDKKVITVNNSPLNQILFGPPGTGKTFETTEAAVKAADPAFYCQLNIDPSTGATPEQRQALTTKYKALSEAGRIRFVTFHQSYGYEEFVEGLRAETTEDNQISYKVSDGIFKSISNAASVSELHLDADINHNGRVWKLSIEGAQRNAAKSHCLEANIAAIGWGKTGDLGQEPRNEYFLSQGTNNQNSLIYFSQEMEEGDLVLCIDSKTSVEAIGVVSGPYRYVEDGVPSRHDYCHQLPIKWLAKDFSVDFKELNNNTQFSLPTCYPLSRLSVAEVLNHLHSLGIELSDSAPSPVQSHIEQHNHVLVIDEINRGNISKIFGELITLIEESKRAGNNEEITLTLPYSGKTFSVPNNLYIIGTMNTADRSLVTMDTALRRRFDFKEMMPKPELFNNRSVKGIDLTRLLATLNKRIEVLYDREHTLGHAFLFPVFNETDEDNAFIKLKDAFKNKIIPLLEEYFYEDWNKIRLVLGDNQKELADGRDYAFIQTHTDSYDALFGNNHGLETYEDSKVTYKLKAFDDAVWDQPEAYITIYSKSE